MTSSGASQPNGAERAGALAALMAVSRLLADTGEGGRDVVHAAIVREARSCFGASAVALTEHVGGRRLAVVAGDGADRELGVDQIRPVAELIDRRVRMLRLDPARTVELAPLLGRSVPGPSLLLLLTGERSARDAVLVCAGLPGGPVTGVEADVATAYGDAAAAALGRLRVAEEHERQAARQEALTRAAKGLNESLDLDTVLARICLEAATILEADVATVYRRDADGLTIAAAHGLPVEAIGYVLPIGGGLAGKVALHGRAMLTNHYPRISGLPADAPLVQAQRALAAPMRWDGELRGVLSVGYTSGGLTDQADLRLLETFAELAAVACANASAHAGLAQAARTDGLTGCLNHAALHEGLAREIERLSRHESGALSLILFDLDDFKQVNEAHGHLVGDEVLRRAGLALRLATRPYDLTARYGGDEFAVVVVEAEEEEACETADRALERMGEAIAELAPGTTVATAGVAQWSPDVTPVELIARADRALLYAKHEGRRGRALAFSAVADHFRPGRFARHDRGLPEPPPMPAMPERPWPEHRMDDRLRKRSRQLAAANALGAQLAAMTDVDSILEAAVTELHRAFGFFFVAVVCIRGDGTVQASAMRGAPHLQLVEEPWSQPADSGLIGRALRERRSVLSNDVMAEPEYLQSAEMGDVRSQLVVPLWLGDTLWGAIDVEETDPGAFDEDDLLLLRTVADQIGSAMRSAQLFEQIERAYLGTAEALAAALEAKDAYTAHHARSIVEQAEAVGTALGLTEPELRDLRFAAVFHDIGKIAIPERILHKTSPLDDAERRVMERHTIVGEQILAPVEFLAGVRILVRHEHERYDGRGYPDSLAGEDIPLGSRIILACDALHAMTSDRPYRKAMSLERALDELRRHSGTQFDARVVETLIRLVAGEG
jgi:diguanylate cyclase (GGDEF)-like protein